MSTTPAPTWQLAQKAPFEAFGILYYPLFRSRADLPTSVDDADMAWAVTANANLEGTGYTLSQPSVLTLAAYHHAMAELSHNAAFLPLAAAAGENLINPLTDLRRLVPDVTAAPLYPDFPTQVMEISEAQFRYDQMCHYLSTYGVEALAGALGLDVTVGEGWMPSAAETPKTEADETLVAPKVLHLLVTVEDLQAVVAERLSRATRMHPAEIESTLLVFSDTASGATPASFPKIGFHENMMELIRLAAQADSGMLERTCAGLAQHPGDLLKAVMYVLGTNPAAHLTTRQKKGFCRAFERFGTKAIAHNIADAGRTERLAPNFLSVARFGGPHLREAIELVESGKVRPWASELEAHWDEVEGLCDPQRRREMAGLLEGCHREGMELSDNLKNAEATWQRLLAHYGLRPGMLLRSLSRLMKAGCPDYLVADKLALHTSSYSLPTLVSTVTAMSDAGVDLSELRSSLPRRGAKAAPQREQLDADTRRQICRAFTPLIEARLRDLETPLRGRRVYLDTADISLVGSALRPNETGDTGTAWPPAGMAYDLPEDKILRFFTFWDDRNARVDVDLHFEGRTVEGERFHIGWNGPFRNSGMVTSGDITTSHDSVEYLDIDMAAACAAGIDHVVQYQHIYSGRTSWKDIETCYSGALLVSQTNAVVKLYNGKNLLFRDDLTGEGIDLTYASINVPNHYVRILRGANIPTGDLAYSLADYLEALFAAQEVTLVDTQEEAEVRVCVGRCDDPEVISLFDEGFYLS